jgi:hypothetical protein
LLTNARKVLVKGKHKDKAVPVTDRGGPYGYETSRLPHLLDNQLTNDGNRGPRTTLRLALPFKYLSWVVLPGAYAPASIVHRVIGALKPPQHHKAVVLEEQIYRIILIYNSFRHPDYLMR